MSYLDNFLHRTTQYNYLQEMACRARVWMVRGSIPINHHLFSAVNCKQARLSLLRYNEQVGKCPQSVTLLACTVCNNSMGKSVSVGDTLPHTVVGVCGEFQRTGRFLQRGI